MRNLVGAAVFGFELDKIMGPVMLGLLGSLFLFVALGASYGVSRGGKRAAIRFVTVIIAMFAALLLTPAVSKIFVGVNIPGLGKSAGQFIEDFLVSSAGQSFVDGAPDLVELIKAFAVVIVNFGVFYIMYYAMKSLTWILYAVLALKLAPKYEDKETKTKAAAHRLAGLGFGVVTGLVFFGFFMMPVLGIMHTVNQAAEYEPEFSSFSLADADEVETTGMTRTLANVYGAVKETSDQMQNSAFGKITKYTGLQAMSGWSFGYLTTVKTDKFEINVRDDLMQLGKVASDSLAISYELSRPGKFIDKVKTWSSNDYVALQKVVDRIFETELIQTAFESMDVVITFAEDKKVLDSTFESVSGKNDSATIASGYTAIGKLANYEAVKHDLYNLIDIAKMLFAQPNEDDRGVGIYWELQKVMNGFKSSNFWENDAVVTNLITKLERTESGFERTNAERLTDPLFDTNLIQILLSDQSFKNLYAAQLEKMLKLEEGQAELDVDLNAGNYLTVSSDVADVMASVVQVVPTLSEIMYSGEGVAGALGAIDDTDLRATSNVLDKLTNSKGVGKIVRSLFIGVVQEMDLGDTSDPTTGPMIENAMQSIEDALDPVAMEPVDWYQMLISIREIVEFAASMTGEGITAEQLQTLLETIAGDEVLAPIVLNIFTQALDAVAEQSDGMVDINFDVAEGMENEFLGILADTAATMFELIAGDENNNPDFTTSEGVLAFLGGDGVLAQMAALNAENPGAVVIDLSGAETLNEADFNAAIDTLFNGNTEVNLDDVKALFNWTETTEG